MAPKKKSSHSLRRMRWDTAVLLLNGALREPKDVARLVRGGAALICADGGAKHAAALGLEPRLVIGDMDSLPSRLPRWKSTTFLCDFDLDRSDFEKALRFAASRGLRQVWIAGALGARLDHTLVNLALIETYSEILPLALADAGASILGPGVHRLDCRRGARLTILPATPQAKVSLSGVRFPLAERVLARTSLGLSNEALSRTVRLEVHAGRVWAFR
ncbi:MAG: thiamine diphosphokinase [Elusimicrobia bacterium]|nr:thiamine diphosphokinase [Elusimicrobiota bacterium]